MVFNPPPIPKNIERNFVIIHPCDRTQSDFVRLILPFQQFLFPNEFKLIPQIMLPPCTNKDILKRTKAIVFQKPTAPPRMEMVKMYAKLKKECGFLLVLDIDDLMWELSPVIKSYTNGVDTESIVKERLKFILPLFDIVVTSTRYLASRVKSDFGHRDVRVMPNGVPRAFYGMQKRNHAINGKPKVMYAGNAGHFREDMPGDLAGAWIPYLIKNIEEEKIDFYTFGTPYFLKHLEGKFTSIPFTNILEFPQVVAQYVPDFYLAPLESNNFNRAKSDLKLKEAAALGSVFLGSDFAGSPYSYAPKNQLISENTIEELEQKFKNLLNENEFKNALEEQYKNLSEKHWFIEDKEFQKKLLLTYLQ